MYSCQRFLSQKERRLTSGNKYGKSLIAAQQFAFGQTPGIPPAAFSTVEMLITHSANNDKRLIGVVRLNHCKFIFSFERRRVPS